MTPDAEGSPPEVPDIERRVRFYPRQAVGLVLLASMPVLAMAGLAGTREDQVRHVSPSLEVEVEYPVRLRATRTGALRLVATNRSGGRLEAVSVTFPEGYLSGFAAAAAVPGASADRELRLAPLGVGDSHTVQVDLTAERFGWHEGRLRVVTSAGDTLTIPLRTLILP